MNNRHYCSTEMLNVFTVGYFIVSVCFFYLPKCFALWTHPYLCSSITLQSWATVAISNETYSKTLLVEENSKMKTAVFCINKDYLWDNLSWEMKTCRWFSLVCKSAENLIFGTDLRAWATSCTHGGVFSAEWSKLHNPTEPALRSGRRSLSQIRPCFLSPSTVQKANKGKLP